MTEWTRKKWIDRDAYYKGRKIVVEEADDEYYHASYQDNVPIPEGFFIEQKNLGRGESVGKIPRDDRELVFKEWRTWFR